MASHLLPPLSAADLSVQGRNFLITGGTQGLGLAIAQHLRDCGASALVLVSSRSQKQAQEAVQALGHKCQVHFVQTDLSRAEECQTVVDKAVALLQQDHDNNDVPLISGVVNAAAITERGNLFTTTPEAFDRQMNLNLRAPFLVTQAAAKHMLEHKQKNKNTPTCSIINIGSVASHGGAPFVMAYSASKAGLTSLTKCNAAELAPHGIRVNGVTMGWCYTTNEDALQQRQLQDKGINESWIDNADASVPLGRILRPTDVARTVGFLLSDASAMMTASMVELHPEFAHGMLSLQATDER